MSTISDQYELTNENFRSILDYLDRSGRDLKVIEANDGFLHIILDKVTYRIGLINFHISILIGASNQFSKDLLLGDTQFMIDNFVGIIGTIKQLKKKLESN